MNVIKCFIFGRQYLTPEQHFYLLESYSVQSLFCLKKRSSEFCLICLKFISEKMIFGELLCFTVFHYATEYYILSVLGHLVQSIQLSIQTSDLFDQFLWYFIIEMNKQYYE